MAARTLAWAQCLSNTAGTTIDVLCNGTTDTTVDPTAVTSLTALFATDKAFEVTAGNSISIRWGGIAATTLATAANTQTWTCNVYYETSQNLWETTATDTLAPGAGSSTRTCDRTLTFTPTHSGTVRIVVRYRCIVTATSTVVCDYNTDGGNFGSPAVSVTVGATNVGFTPGLIRAGTTISSITPTFPGATGGSSGTQGYFPDSVTSTWVTGHAPRSSEASESYTVSWRDATPTQFASTTINSGTSTSIATSRQIAPSTSFPAANTSVNMKLTPNNSALSTANSGTGLPWVHWTTLASGMTGTTDAAGKFVDASKASVFSADPRLQLHAHAQKTSTWPNNPPDPGSPTPYDNYGDDFFLYIISADLFYGWFGAFNMVAVGQNGITGSMHLADTTVTSPTAGGSGDHTTSLTTVTTAGNPVGWSRQSTPFGFTPGPPAGQWHWWCESATDGTNTWSRTNSYAVYKQSHADVLGPFATFAAGMSFVSAYRDNIALEVFGALYTGDSSVTHEAFPGDTVIVGCRGLYDSNGSGVYSPISVDLGTIPVIKIFRYNQATQLVEYAVGGASTMVNMTQDPNDGNIWTYSWAIPSNQAKDHYYAVMSAQLLGGDKFTQNVLIPLGVGPAHLSLN